MFLWYKVCCACVVQYGTKGEKKSKIGKRPGQGSRITSQTKYVIHNIKNFFDQEKREQQTILRNKVHDRVVIATGLSRSTVFNILRSVTPDNTYLTPTRRYDRTRIRVDSTAVAKVIVTPPPP